MRLLSGFSGRFCFHRCMQIVVVELRGLRERPAGQQQIQKPSKNLKIDVKFCFASLFRNHDTHVPVIT